jgi:hypothetical protein
MESKLLVNHSKCTKEKDILCSVKKGTNTGLVMIGIGLYKPWIDILFNGQEPTWLSDQRPDSVSVIHVHAKRLNTVGEKLDKFHEKMRFKSRFTALTLRITGEVILYPFRSRIPKWQFSSQIFPCDRVIEIQIPDSYLSMKWKDLGTFKYFFEETDRDFLVLTNTSSFINLINLDLLLQRLPKSGTYYGPRPHDGANFVSGSFRIFSRDVVLSILENSTSMRATLLEDVALGRLLNSLGITPSFFEFTMFSSTQEICDAKIEDLESVVHFRLKAGTNENRQDVQLMKALHKKLQSDVIQSKQDGS